MTHQNERMVARAVVHLSIPDLELQVTGEYDWRAETLLVEPEWIVAYATFCAVVSVAPETLGGVVADLAGELLAKACGDSEGTAVDAVETEFDGGQTVRVDMAVSIGPPMREATT